MGAGHGLWMLLPMLLLLGLGCAGIFLLGRWSLGYGPQSWRGRRPWGDPRYSALQVLNERFARGEIAQEEYAEKKAALLADG
jgi:uncharacterized membrane protein